MRLGQFLSLRFSLVSGNCVGEGALILVVFPMIYGRYFEHDLIVYIVPCF
jgi:hypothetical protein